MIFVADGARKAFVSDQTDNFDLLGDGASRRRLAISVAEAGRGCLRGEMMEMKPVIPKTILYYNRNIRVIYNKTLPHEMPARSALITRRTYLTRSAEALSVVRIGSVCDGSYSHRGVSANDPAGKIRPRNAG